jgi:hypothetical protein
MELGFRPTINSILMILIGLGMIAFGGLLLFTWRRFHAVGFLLTGIGNILFALTNGFTNMSPLGHTLYRFALLAYAGGLPLIGYFLYQEMR